MLIDGIIFIILHLINVFLLASNWLWVDLFQGERKFLEIIRALETIAYFLFNLKFWQKYLGMDLLEWTLGKARHLSIFVWHLLEKRIFCIITVISQIPRSFISAVGGARNLIVLWRSLIIITTIFLEVYSMLELAIVRVIQWVFANPSLITFMSPWGHSILAAAGSKQIWRVSWMLSVIDFEETCSLFQSAFLIFFFLYLYLILQ